MKNFILAGITVLILGFHSCGDQYVTEEITEEVLPLTYTGNFKINPANWTSATDIAGPYYFCEFEIPELTLEVLEYGIMQAFYCYTFEGNDERYAPLPYEDYDLDNRYTEYFTVEFSDGLVTFLYKTDDGFRPPKRVYDFRVRFLW
jgi:hypothetical protein